MKRERESILYLFPVFTITESTGNTYTLYIIHYIRLYLFKVPKVPITKTLNLIK